VAILAPWSFRPPLVYDTLSGWPMVVYFRNVGDAPVQVVAAGGLPVLSDEPLPQEKIAGYLASVKRQRADSLVRAGEYVKFVVDDPDGLAWLPAKTDHTTYLYVFAIVEMPRAALISNRWVRELCLVSKTYEAFKPCETHNDAYAAAS
jgi:hypothetical protein